MTNVPETLVESFTYLFRLYDYQGMKGSGKKSPKAWLQDTTKDEQAYKDDKGGDHEELVEVLMTNWGFNYLAAH